VILRFSGIISLRTHTKKGKDALSLSHTRPNVFRNVGANMLPRVGANMFPRVRANMFPRARSSSSNTLIRARSSSVPNLVAEYLSLVVEYRSLVLD
jgi:hypothetical protein